VALGPDLAVLVLVLVLVPVGSGVAVHVYEVLSLAFCRAGAAMDKSSSLETSKLMVSDPAGLLILEV
jgi:hypothetical protein